MMDNDLKILLINILKVEPTAFKDQVIIVTGAGQGIGFYTARAFALLGGKVILAEISETGHEAEQIICDEGGLAKFIPTDVSSPDSINELKITVQKEFGSPSILVNNAIFISQESVVNTSVEDWNRTLAVNLSGTFLTCHAFLPEMIKNRYGKIINMVSTDAMPGLSAYIASKQGITGFTQSLALELDQTGVYVVPFAPGMVRTAGIESVAEGLAPILGLTPDEFLKLSLHPAYDGLMPLEHAAAATIYLTLNLAEEYHGEVINGYEVLEKAGVIKNELQAVVSNQVENFEISSSSQNLNDQLAQILDETAKEFDQLPIFVRPMAKRGFKTKAGASLTDWQQLIKGINTASSTIPKDMAARLTALAKYYREVPQETARFTKDEAFLQEIMQTTQYRLSVIDKLNQIYLDGTSTHQ